jgi:hypothetical protein
MSPEAPAPHASTRDVPDLYRALAHDELTDGERGHVLFCVSTVDLNQGAGDLYVALGLAAALHRAGWGVSFWPTERWDDAPDEVADVAVVMIESCVPGLLAPSTATVAWVRNWTASWARLPYLDDFDAVWASSQAAADHVSAAYDGRVEVVPIAVDPHVFDAPDLPRDLKVVTTANFWGAERKIQRALDRLAESVPVDWFGANGAHLERSPHIRHHDRVDFFALREVYGRSVLVIDDLIDPAREFGTHNSRIYEALACGALPLVNTQDGLDELGLGGLPVYSDADSLRDVALGLLAAPEETAQLVQSLRNVVLSRHSYDHRLPIVTTSFADAVSRARPRTSRPAMLTWATLQQERLRKAVREGDGHLITVRRLENEIVALRDEIGALQADLLATVGPLEEFDELRSSKAYRALERYRGLVGRVSPPR